MNPKLNRAQELLFETAFHALVVIGIILSTVALVHYITAKHMHISAIKILLDVGSAMSALSWLILTLWCVRCALTQKSTAVGNIPCMRSARTVSLELYSETF